MYPVASISRGLRLVDFIAIYIAINLLCFAQCDHHHLPVIPTEVVLGHSLTGYFSRSQAPYFKKTNGPGSIASETNPSTELPQPRPNPWNIDAPAIGRKAATMLRKIVVAATAEAEYIVKASTKYTCIGTLIGRVSDV